MQMTLRQLDLPLEHPFTIARGTITVRRALVVRLEHNGVVGYGEVSENTYYQHTVESLADCLEKARPILHQYVENSPESMWQKAYEMLDGNLFALSAIDIAAHDFFARNERLPTYKRWGLSWNEVAESSFTIGIDSIEKMVAKLHENDGWATYKIKLGTESDLDIIRELRKHTGATFRVDANCGWSADQTIQLSKEFADLDVQFIEQPLAADATEHDKKRVFHESALPIMADESCLVESDVQACHSYFHGINVKLCKCGGLTPAIRMLRQARELGMKTMVGCMIESSLGISAAAQLLPLLDYADLDGAKLLSDDPAEGVQIDRGKVTPSPELGHGARLKDDHE